MQSLHDLQVNWKAYIYAEDHESVLSEITCESARERMDIYAEAHGARLLEAMQKIFPIMEKVMGEDAFSDIVFHYLIKHPSTYFSIAKIGIHFSAYLNEKNALYGDMANLEWSISNAIDAKDATPLTQSDLQQIPQNDWENIVFELHSSLQLLEFSTPVLEIYKAALLDDEFEKAMTNNQHKTQKIYCRVYRKGLQVYYQSIDHLEWLFLTCIQKKQTFSEICEKISEHKAQDEAVNYALSKIIQWLNDEILIGAKG